MQFLLNLPKQPINQPPSSTTSIQSKTSPKKQSSSSLQLPQIKQNFDLSKDQGIKRLLSGILNQDLTNPNNNDPQLTRVKNNLLLILLLLSAYGIYYLIGQFLDVILIAYIAGIAYHQSRDRFTDLVINQNTYKDHTSSLTKRIVKAFVWLIIGFIFPRIRYLLSNPHKIHDLLSLDYYLISIQRTNSFVVLTCQICIGLHILYLLFGNFLNKLLLKIRPTNISVIRTLYAMIALAVIIGLVIVIPSAFLKQVTGLGHIIQESVENKLGCQIITFKDDDNDTLPLCTQKISSQNQFIRQTMFDFRQQNQTVQECLIVLEKFEQEYLQQYLNKFQTISKNIYHYEEILCTWYAFVHKAVVYSGITIEGSTQDIHKVLSTGGSLFKLIFGNLTWIISKFSNSIFNLTTFITTFMLTIRMSNISNTLKQILSHNKHQLVSSITDLISATFFIAFWHFILSILLLQIFKITPINLIIATLLSSMALFPFFRPWLGVFFVSMIRMVIIQQYYITVFFIIFYYILSQKIYSVHYRKMQLHEIVTNMSVLFGIYQFGVVGVFYGPLIIIVYQCVQKELFKRYIYNKESNVSKNV